MESEVRKNTQGRENTNMIGNLSFFDATNNVVRLAEINNLKNLYEYLGEATI